MHPLSSGGDTFYCYNLYGVRNEERRPWGLYCATLNERCTDIERCDAKHNKKLDNFPSIIVKNLYDLEISTFFKK